MISSFLDLAEAECIQRVSSGSWQIVADLPVNFNCAIELSLIFTSVRPDISKLPLNDFAVRLFRKRSHKYYFSGKSVT